MKGNQLITNKSQIVGEILAFLVCHPNAQDTFEGIVEWWLMERTIMFQETRVKEALTWLLDNGFIVGLRSDYSEVCYRVNSSRIEEIRELVDQMLK